VVYTVGEVTSRNLGCHVAAVAILAGWPLFNSRRFTGMSRGASLSADRIMARGRAAVGGLFRQKVSQMSEVMDIMLKIGVTEEVTRVFSEISRLMKDALGHVANLEKSFGSLTGRAQIGREARRGIGAAGAAALDPGLFRRVLKSSRGSRESTACPETGWSHGSQ